MTVGLNIELDEIERKILIKVEGRLDAPSSPSLEKRINSLIEEGKYHILIDFSKIEYLSSAGLRLLLSATKKLKAKEGNLVLFSIPEEVMEIIKLAGFQKILIICKNEQEALQHS